MMGWTTNLNWIADFVHQQYLHFANIYNTGGVLATFWCKLHRNLRLEEMYHGMVRCDGLALAAAVEALKGGFSRGEMFC